jgi:hypothetical protein
MCFQGQSHTRQSWLCVVCDVSLKFSEMCNHQSDASEELDFSQASTSVFIQTTCTRHFSWIQMTGLTKRPETSMNLSRWRYAPTQKRDIMVLNKFELLLLKGEEHMTEITGHYVMVTNVICICKEGVLVGIITPSWIYWRKLLFFY